MEIVRNMKLHECFHKWKIHHICENKKNISRICRDIKLSPYLRDIFVPHTYCMEISFKFLIFNFEYMKIWVKCFFFSTVTVKSIYFTFILLTVKIKPNFVTFLLSNLHCAKKVRFGYHYLL